MMKEKKKLKQTKMHRSQKETGTPVDSTKKRSRATKLYVRGVLIRGEAARPINGKLPLGATHEIVEENPDGLPTIRRRRFSAF